MKKVLLGIFLALSTMSLFGCGFFHRNYLVPELSLNEEKLAKDLEAKYLSYDDIEVDGKSVKSAVKQYTEEFNNICGSSTVAASTINQAQKDYLKRNRNNIMNNLILLMDIRYRQYERAFYNVGATAGSAFDIAVLGATAAGAVSGGTQTKAVLSAIAAGLTGTRLALEKNFLYEQTSQIIVKQMHTSRKDKFDNIDRRMKDDDVFTYPLERGLVDIADYFYSGTIVNALQATTEKLNQKTIEEEVKHVQDVRLLASGAMGTETVTIENQKTPKPVDPSKPPTPN